MYSVCIICTDLMKPDEVLYFTKCGHLFHHVCLKRWIDTSRTCPQCRNTTTTNCIFRFYSNVPNESMDEPAVSNSNLSESLKVKEERLKALNDDLKKKEELLKSYEQKLQHAGAGPSSGQTNRGEVSSDQPSTSGGCTGSGTSRTFESTQSRRQEPLQLVQPLQPLRLVQPLPYLSATGLMGNRSRNVERATPAPAQTQHDPIPQLQPLQYLTMPEDLKKDLENALNAALQKDLQYKIRKLRLNHLDSLR